MDLSDNAIKTLGLTRDPFLAYTDQQSYYSDALLDATKERTLADVERPGSITLIGGESHSGRSFLLIWLLANLPQEAEIYGFKARAGTPYETIDLTLREALTQHGIEDPSRSLIELFGERIQQDRQPVIAIDDAGLLDNETLARLFRLRDKLRDRARSVPRFLLVGEPGLLSRIDRILVDSSSVYRTTVTPLNPEQTQAYLRHRLIAAGARDPDALIPNDLARELHQQSNGRPGVLNQLAQAALARVVTERTVSPTRAGASRSASTANAREAEAQPRELPKDVAGDVFHRRNSTSTPTPAAPAAAAANSDLPRDSVRVPEVAAEPDIANDVPQRPADEPDPTPAAAPEKPSADAAPASTHSADETAALPDPGDEHETATQPEVTTRPPFWQHRGFVPAVAAVVVIGVFVPIVLSLLDSSPNDGVTESREIDLPDFTAMRPMPEPTRPDTTTGIDTLGVASIETLETPPPPEDPGVLADPPQAPEPDLAQDALNEAPAIDIAPAPEPPAESSPATEPEEPPAAPRERATEPTPPPETAAAVGGSGDSSWLQSQNDDRFTIQLVAARDMSTAQQFIERHALSGVRRIPIQQGDRRYVAVIAGSFATRDQADQSLARLPQAVRDDGPWIRTLGSIKAATP